MNQRWNSSKKSNFNSYNSVSQNYRNSYILLYLCVNPSLKQLFIAFPWRDANSQGKLFTDRRTNSHTKCYSVLLFDFSLLLLFYLSKTKTWTFIMQLLEYTWSCKLLRHVQDLPVAGMGNNELPRCLKYSFVNKVGIRVTNKRTWKRIFYRI